MTVPEYFDPYTTPTRSGSLAYGAHLVRRGAGGLLRKNDDRVPVLPANCVGGLTIRGVAGGTVRTGNWILSTDEAGAVTATVQSGDFVLDADTWEVTHPSGTLTLCFGALNWVAINNPTGFAAEVARPGA